MGWWAHLNALVVHALGLGDGQVGLDVGLAVSDQHHDMLQEDQTTIDTYYNTL